MPSRLPPMSQAIHNWQTLKEFYYLRLYFEGTAASRDKPAGGKTSSPTRRRRRRFVEPAFSLLKVTGHFARCFWLPRAQTVLFNLSARVRRAETSNRPLYLSPSIDVAGAIIADDTYGSPPHVTSPARIDAAIVNRGGEIIGALMFALCAALGRPRDLYLFRFYAARALWTLTFRILRPSSVKMFVWYSKMPVVAAAKALGIKTTDIQHGIIYGDHPFYAPPTMGLDGATSILTPSRFSVYGEYWRQKLIAAGWPAAQVDIAGYMLDIAPARPVRIETPYVLYTSQPGYAAQIARHVRAILPTVVERGWKVVIAPHPMENRDSYAALLSDSILVLDNDSYDLLRQCSVHVSVSSTLLWEAMVFGKSSYILDFDKAPLDTLSDLLSFRLARKLFGDEFPEPFELPTTPAKDYFFSSEIAPIAGGA